MVLQTLHCGEHERRMERTVIKRRGCNQRSLCESTGGIQTMYDEYVDMTWSEAVTALAVMGIIVFLLLH